MPSRPYSGRAMLVAWLTLAMVAGGFANQARAEEPPSIGAIEELVQRHIAEGQLSGAVTLVARRGEIVHLAAQGQSDLERKTEMRSETMFCIASMTKPIAAAALLILVDEGKVQLDDPLSDYIPEFKQAQLDGQPLDQPITLRHCLTHTAGLGGGQQNVGSLEETAQAIAARPLAFKPGTRWQYSPGLSVIGRVVEVAAEMPFEQFLAERIFQPLGMENSTFHPSSEQQQRLAVLYQPGPQPKTLAKTEHWLSEVSADRTPNPSGGLFSTAEDMYRFHQMLLNEGELEGQRILSAESVKQMRTNQTGDLECGFVPGSSWGLGVAIVRQGEGATAMLSPGSFGHGGAFGTQGWIDPEQEMVFILMIQRTNFGNSDASDLRRDFQQLAVDEK